jgi:predicted metal-dependent hydrolase
VVKSPTARRLALRVDPARSQICLVIPKRTSEKSAWRFAELHREWIIARHAELEKPVPFMNGAIIPVLGIDRMLKITKVPSGGTQITLTDTAIEVRSSREDPSRNIRDFFWNMMQKMALELAQEKTAILEKPLMKVRLRDTRGRWGSCAQDGRMMFCWRLIFAPQLVVDYVVGHECAHLVHMNHSPEFWALCDSLSKDMKYGRDWLNAYGDKVMMYGLQR